MNQSLNLFAGPQWRGRHREQTYGYGEWEEGESGMNGESNMETYSLPYVKQIGSGNLLYDLGNSNQSSVTAYRVGWGSWEGGSRREGTQIYLWLIYIDVGQKPTQYCKAIILQLKISKFNYIKYKSVRHEVKFGDRRMQGGQRAVKGNLQRTRVIIEYSLMTAET